MIDVKEAVRIASDYLKQLYEPTQLNDVLLEEVALSDDEKYWHVTIGFSRPVSTPSDPIRALAEGIFKQDNYKREYKEFQINSDTRQVRYMKIRTA